MSRDLSPPAWFTVPRNPGPSWSIPPVSAPACLGLLDEFQTEWWYYVGVVESADEQFTIQIEVLRENLGTPGFPIEAVVGYAGIGTRSDDRYVSALGVGLGVSTDPGSAQGLTIAPVTDYAYDLNFADLLGITHVRATYTGGAGGAPVGTPGAPYTVHASGIDSDGDTFSADFDLTNQRGLVLEGQSGYVGPGMPGSATLGGGLSSYEFAEPLLNVESGTIVLGDRSYSITAGNLWLDRQVITPPQPATPPPTAPPPSDAAAISSALSQSTAGTPLYCGDWISIKLDGGPTVVLAAFWQPAAGAKQWITGTAVKRPPLGGFGTVYFPPDAMSLNGGRGLIGAHVAAHHVGSDGVDFDINILDPHHPDHSPHWQSAASGYTYATAWAISFDKRLSELGVPAAMYLRLLVGGCEVDMLGNFFSEGAAYIYADEAMTQRIGTAYVEQMGFN
ncbi:MAG TPA: hypothetical protein VGT98_04870 [Candidatus Elarobacter sp.]|nr:hypothetical protein [Candidatus Elarobacter sp.]HEV2740452.1 hypothetical protein [Candidatus Elarobacter sp.]